jgi:hypothetical protein
MSDFEVSPYTKLSGGSDFQAMANQASMYVILWDIGPQKPTMPAKPVLPKGKDGEPEYDIALVEFKEALEVYAEARKAYLAALQEHAKWQKNEGGAIERQFYSCDAYDALVRDPERYYISASTRGSEKLKNHGLPAGYKPGRGQEENIRRAQEGDAEFARLRAADPVFGNPELRP